MDKANTIIRYTKIATAVFIGLVAVADVFGVIISEFISRVWAGRNDTFAIVFLTVDFYVGTILAYVVLFSLYKLLSNMGKDVVFDKANTKLMMIIAIAAFLMGVVCLIGMVAWFGTIYLAVICFFMTLVILCVKAVFDKAIAMKDELDLTI